MSSVSAMPIQIDFEWEKDEAGYRLDRYLGTSSNASLFGLTRVDPPGHLVQNTANMVGGVGPGKGFVEMIQSNGGRIVKYKPFLVCADLARLFAFSARTKEGLLSFVNDWGDLTMRNRSVEPIEPLLVYATTMYQIYTLSEADRAAYLKAEWGSYGFVCGRSVMSLTVNPATQRAQLRYQPDHLLDALLVSFAQDIAAGHTIKECKYCGSFFETGAGAGKRKGALFCSDEHRFAYHNKQRAGRTAKP